jgi:hypothetical protein
VKLFLLWSFPSSPFPLLFQLLTRTLLLRPHRAEKKPDNQKPMLVAIPLPLLSPIRQTLSRCISSSPRRCSKLTRLLVTLAFLSSRYRQHLQDLDGYRPRYGQERRSAGRRRSRQAHLPRRRAGTGCKSSRKEKVIRMNFLLIEEIGKFYFVIVITR